MFILTARHISEETCIGWGGVGVCGCMCVCVCVCDDVRIHKEGLVTDTNVFDPVPSPDC